MLESIDRRIDPYLDRYLDPAGRLGEILFGLIMALGISGAVRLGREAADNRTLLIGILGCNLAWAVVDGAMYVLTEVSSADASCAWRATYARPLATLPPCG